MLNLYIVKIHFAIFLFLSLFHHVSIYFILSADGATWCSYKEQVHVERHDGDSHTCVSQV